MRSKMFLGLATILMVAGLGALKAPVASAATDRASFGQCGGIVHNGAQLVAAWSRMGVLNDPQTRDIVSQAGWNEMDGSLPAFVSQRGMEFQLASAASIEDYGCSPGDMFSVGYRSYGAGEWVIGIVPAKYSPSDVSGHPMPGYKRVVAYVHIVGRANCSNGFREYKRVVIYVKVNKTPYVCRNQKATNYGAQAQCQFGKPKGWKIWAYKWAWNGKAWVKGEHFIIRQYAGKKIVRRWVIYSGQWNKLIGTGVRPKSLCEEVKPSSVYRPNNGKACSAVSWNKKDKKWEVIFVNLIPKKPTPGPGPGPGPTPTPPSAPPTPPTPPAPKDGTQGAGNGTPGSPGGSGAGGSAGSTTQPTECRDRNTGAIRPGPVGSDGWCTDQTGTTTAPPTTGGTSSGGPPPPPPAQCIDPTTGQSRATTSGETKDQFGYCYKP